MKKLHRFIILLSIINFFMMFGALTAQEVKVVQLTETGSYEVFKVTDFTIQKPPVRNGFELLPGFPFVSKAHPSFKNFRNVSIADLEGDGAKEIVVCLDETLFVLNSDGSVRWQFTLDGTSNYPPAIADIDRDGDLEIALQTYGVPATGNVYVFDHTGLILEGWPLNIDNHFFLNAVTLADINKDAMLEIVASERISSSEGRIHALDLAANSIEGWPITIPGTPAFTPSVGNINNDGFLDLITATTTGLYAFNAQGEILPGFPLEEDGAKFSYQSPILADLSDNNEYEIVSARHNDLPGTIAVNNNGEYYGEWPDYDDRWTFATPSVVDIDLDGDFEVFFARPYVSETIPGEVVLGYDHEGNRLEGFNIVDLVGSEGILAIADIDDDGNFEIITGSKASLDNQGLIQAYHIENGSAVSNFPILVPGFTFINGAQIDDINGDGRMDLVALSYQLKFDQTNPDSAFISVFDLDVPYADDKVLWSGYKGSNDHSGWVTSPITSVPETVSETLDIYPNPAVDRIYLEESNLKSKTALIYTVKGEMVDDAEIKDNIIDISGLPAGTYLLKVGENSSKFIKVDP